MKHMLGIDHRHPGGAGRCQQLLLVGHRFPGMRPAGAGIFVELFIDGLVMAHGGVLHVDQQQRNLVAGAMRLARFARRHDLLVVFRQKRVPRSHCSTL